MFKNEFMTKAIEIAKQAFKSQEVPVGAVIVDSETKEIISMAHNQVEYKNDPTAHAEIIAIREACMEIKSKSLSNCDIYVTMQPCAMCMQALSYARIRRIYFGAYDTAFGEYKPEIYGGIHQFESEELLNDFFEDKRKKK